EDFKRSNVEKRVTELRKENKDNPEELRKLDFEFAIVNGLMTKLDEMMAQQRMFAKQITEEQYKKAVEVMGFDFKEQLSPDIVQKQLQKLAKETDEEKQKQLVEASQVILAKLFEAIQNAAKNN